MSLVQAGVQTARRLVVLASHSTQVTALARALGVLTATALARGRAAALARALGVLTATALARGRAAALAQALAGVLKPAAALA